MENVATGVEPRRGDPSAPSTTAPPGAPTTRREARAAAARGSAPADGMRADIQGLRAVAVLVVLVFHFWPDGLTGGYVGVDVFFVISGFLISSHLLRSPPTTGRLLAQFWARRVRRLLPAASLVLLATLGASLLWMPSTLLSSIARETAASAVSLENWVLAGSATDYLAADSEPSPLQHYWSLSVEEQFYVAWPILIALLWFLGRRRRPLAWVGTGLLGVTAASLAASVVLTSRDPAGAYFVTHTRVWELGIGAVLAFAVHLGWRLRAGWLRAVLAWAGLGAIAWSAWSYGAATPFPGTAALVPTVGAALVIAAATDGLRGGPGVLLGSRPAQVLGDLSYSVYLWHWPVVVIAPHALGHPMALWEKLVAVAAVVGVAALTKRFVEDPVRRARPLTGSSARSFALALASVVVLGGGSFAVIQQAQTAQAAEQQELAREVASGGCIGAEVTRNDACKSFAGDELLSSPAVAAADKSVLYADGCWSNRPYTAHRVCTYGKKGASTRVALIGNSHAGHWQPALAPIAEKNGWQLDTYLVSQCYTVDLPLEFGSTTLTRNCRAWNAWATAEIVREKYDLVVMSNRTFQQVVGVSSARKAAVAQQAYAETLATFTDAGLRVVVLRDTPASADSAPDCVAAHPDDVEACSRPQAQAVEPDPLDAAAQADTSGLVSRVDLTDLFCREGRCHVVIGGLITYFDHGHLTATFAKTLVPDLAPTLEKAVAAGR